MFTIKRTYFILNGTHANLFKKPHNNRCPNNRFIINKSGNKNKPVFDIQPAKNRSSVIIIFAVRVFQLKNGICSHLFS